MRNTVYDNMLGLYVSNPVKYALTKQKNFNKFYVVFYFKYSYPKCIDLCAKIEILCRHANHKLLGHSLYLSIIPFPPKCFAS